MYRNSPPLFFISLALIFLSFTKVAGQERMDYLAWYDRQVGIENTALYQGLRYQEKYRTVNEKTPYFGSPRFVEGWVSYGGQLFPDLNLKYNVFDDQLIFKQKDDLGGVSILLFKYQVDSFQLEEKKFVNLKTKSGEIEGFHEVLYRSPVLSMYAKHRKNDFRRRDRNTLYYEFIEIPVEFILFYEDAYTTLRKKKDIQALFPEISKDIDAFYRENRVLRNKDEEVFYERLAEFLAGNIPNRK